MSTLLIAPSLLLADAPCAPPESMKERLQGKPDAATLTELGVWFAERQQYACAVDAFATSLQVEPEQKDLPHVAFMLGVSLYFSGETKDAIAALQQAEQLGYHDVKLHVILATIFDASHSTKESEEEWRAALTFDPESSTALDALSDDLLLEGDYPGAIGLLETPRLLGQRTPQQSLNLAAAYAKTAKLDEAARVLQDGLNTSPDSLPVANRLAETLMALLRPDEAIAVLQLAAEKHPEDADTSVHLLETLMAAHSEKALGVGRKLLAALPQNPKLLALVGALEMRNGDPRSARTDLERAVALGDQTSETKENLAQVLKALGNTP